MIKRQMIADIAKGESGKMSNKKLVAFFVAVVIVVMTLPMIPEKAFGDTYTVTLIWEHQWVFVEDPDHRYSGYYDVEYDDGGNPFYRYGDEITYVGRESVRTELGDYNPVQIIIYDDDFYLTGNEFKEANKDMRYFSYEVTGWSTEPDGEVLIESNQPFWQVPRLLRDGLTLYPVVWHQLPNITYHNTYTGEKYESRGGYIEAAVSEFYERPYHYQAGWAEEPGGALKYQYGDDVTKSGHMDLYSVWEQSRISNIPPVNRFLEHYDNHFMFGGRYWRKIGAGNDKALLIYDGSMELGGFEPNGTTTDLYLRVKDFCTDWYNGFSGAEQAAVCSTYKGETVHKSVQFPPLQGEKLFLLSMPEAWTYFSDNNDRKFSGLHTNRWFLRNGEDRLRPEVNEDNCSFEIVDADGTWSNVPVKFLFWVYAEDYGLIFAAGERPAFVLDLTKVLFTSPSSGSKSFTPTDGSSFGEFSGNYDRYQQKMTLLDETYKDFAAQVNGSDRAAVTPGGTLEVSYANAVTDTENESNRYISAMLCDRDGEVIGYASMKPSASSGTWELKMPQNLNVSDAVYTLKVFNEQQNGDGCSDYASPFSVISLTVFPAGSGTENDPWQIGPGLQLNTMPAGWYEVTGSMTLRGRIAVIGTVHLNLGAGTVLTAAQGINVASENSLIIDGNGTLNATAPTGAANQDKWGYAGIGGGIGESCGTVTINGGIVNATGSVWGAGIGGGKGGGNGGNITINGGTVTAQCYDPDDPDVGLAAGIGGGDLGDGGTILITGGTVYARGNRGSAGIGGGGYSSGGTITITGGHVTAIGASYPNGRSGAGIGAGRVRNNATSGDSGNITITGGTVIAVGGNNAQAIGISNEVAANDSGSLTIGAGLMVKAGDSESTAVISIGDLVSACRNTWAMIGSNLPFGVPDFTLPDNITTVEEEAFMGAVMSVVFVPATCTSIGPRAFKDCSALTQIRIPAGCAIGADAFDGCTQVFVYSTAGSPAETYCQGHENCVFVEE